jgi:hydrogenase nickel incorporation protein HypA/HybF
MHELSIAMSIVATVQHESERLHDRSIQTVHVRLGALFGVVPDALQFSYALATAETPLEGSKLEIEDSPVLVFCAACDSRRPVVSIQHMCCATCGTPCSEIVQGRELVVTSLEIAA